MAARNTIAYGFGFEPGSVKYLPTFGFTPVPTPVTVRETPQVVMPKRSGITSASAIKLKPSGKREGPDVVLPKRAASSPILPSS